MSEDIKELCPKLLATGTISLATTGQTTFYTVPTGFRLIPFGVGIKAGEDAGDSTLTVGQSTALTDFLDTQTLSNLDAENDYVFLTPVPNATPVKQKTYAAGAVIQGDVTSADGGATNTFYYFGTLEAV